MRALIIFVVCFICNRFRSAAEIEGRESRAQTSAKYGSTKVSKVRSKRADRALIVFLYRLFPSVLDVLDLDVSEAIVEKWIG